jgi:HD-GYP domain-containing protein (c-di-GMP phosphodiesterase class II)
MMDTNGTMRSEAELRNPGGAVATAPGEPPPGRSPDERPVSREDYERLVQENEGLADEVLRTYEQLNLIFDVTAQVAALTDTQEVKRLLCERLCGILRTQGIWCVGRAAFADDFLLRDPVACGNCPLEAEGEQAITALAREVRLADACHRVLVRTIPLTDACCGVREIQVMAGPLVDLEGADPLVICAIRCREVFTAGDMMLLDSVLTYGAHVLRNLNLVDRLKRTSFEAVRALVNAIDKKDRYTCGHSERVGILARLTGREMKLPAEQLQELEWAGLLHDIGKIGIPEEILNKPGRLTEGEYSIIKEHPQMSYDVLVPVASLARVLVAVVEHHENFDGSGYPKHLRGEEISLAGRILHVVDVFDALTSARSYRGAYDVGRAMKIIRQDAGTKLDPQVVKYFSAVVGRLERSCPPELEELFAAPVQEPA